MLTKKQRLHKLKKRTLLRIIGSKGQAVPVFVVGTQRSGTNMFAEVLDRSPQTECYHENDDEAFDNYVLRDESTIRDLINNSYAKVVVFKSICDSQNAKFLLGLHSQAHAVWVYRHYSDVVNSSLKMWPANYRENYLYKMLFDPRSAGWRVENVAPEDMKLVEEFYHARVSDASARALIWYLRNALYFQQNLDHDSRVLLVNYERLVTQAPEQFQRVFSSLGLEYQGSLIQSVFSSSVRKSAVLDLDPEIRQLCEQMYDKLETVLRESER